MSGRIVPPFLALLAAGVVAPGCAEERAGPAPRTTTVIGRVSVGGQPPPRGWIEFQPIDGTRGLLRSAPVKPDGSFHAREVPVGLTAMRFVSTRPVQTGNPRIDHLLLRASAAYHIRRTIRPATQAPEPLEIDLVEEVLKL